MKPMNRWIRLVLAALALFLSGIIYAWTFLKEPLAALYGWEMQGASLALNYTLTLCFFCLGGLVSGLISKKVSAKLRMVIAGAMVLAGFTLVSRLDGTSAFLLYLGYGFLTGGGIGVVYNTVIGLTNQWFPDKKGIANGAMMLAFGFSSLLLGNLASSLFETALTWRGTFLLYGIVIGLCLAAFGFVIRAPKAGEVPEAAVKAAGASAKDVPPLKMLATPSFWILFVLIVIMNGICTVAIGSSKQLILGIDENAASLAALGAGLVSVTNGFGRLFWGWLFDTWGIKRSRVLDSIVLLAAPALLLIGLVTGSTALAFAGLMLIGVVYSFSPTASSALVLDLYGRKNFALNFSIINLTLIPASFASTIMGGMSSTATFAVLTGLAAAGCVLQIVSVLVPGKKA